MTAAGGTPPARQVAGVVDLDAARAARAAAQRVEGRLTEPQRVALRKLRSARRRLTTRTS